MAKKKCDGYKLTMPVSTTAFRFELNVVDTDGNKYHLRVKRPDDRPTLVRKALRTMAQFWPDFDWPFEADDSNEITSIG